jgi:PASTA domain-containing protein
MTTPPFGSDGVNMRLGTLLPRAVVIALIWVLATAAFTFAADKTQLVSGATPKPDPAAAQPPDLTVPSVTGQAFVFAKGMLEDSGFAWHVVGSVHGYAGNQVIAQSPAAGTRVVDTGAPTVVLNLVRGKYAENGVPEDTPSYTGTAIKLPGVTAPAAPKSKPAKKPVTKKPSRKPVTKKPSRKPVTKKPSRKPVTKKPAKKPKAVKKQTVKASAKRPPAFESPRAPEEPLDEIPLTARAGQLAAWIDSRPKRTNRNVQHWLYQHAWIVTGAEFGWWHGEQALVKLIAVDQKVEQIWGMGHRSEKVARRALAKVRRLQK